MYPAPRSRSPYLSPSPILQSALHSHRAHHLDLIPPLDGYRPLVHSLRSSTSIRGLDARAAALSALHEGRMLRDRAVRNAITRQQAEAAEHAAHSRREMRHLDSQMHREALLHRQHQAQVALAVESEHRRRRMSLDNVRTVDAVHRAELAMEVEAQEQILEQNRDLAAGTDLRFGSPFLQGGLDVRDPYVDDFDMDPSIFTGRAGLRSRFSPVTAGERLFY